MRSQINIVHFDWGNSRLYKNEFFKKGGMQFHNPICVRTYSVFLIHFEWKALHALLPNALIQKTGLKSCNTLACPDFGHTFSVSSSIARQIGSKLSFEGTPIKSSINPLIWSSPIKVPIPVLVPGKVVTVDESYT